MDRDYLKSLGQFNVVYSWGVLHHTGAMSEAFGNVAPLVNEGGKLFISIYNDQRIKSQFWKSIKRLYNRFSKPIRALLILWIGLFFETRAAVVRIIRGQNPLPFRAWAEKKKAGGCLSGMISSTG